MARTPRTHRPGMPEIALELPSNGRLGDALDYLPLIQHQQPQRITATSLDREAPERGTATYKWHRSERRNAALGGFWDWQSWQWYSWWVQAVRGCCGGIFTKDSA